MFLPGVGNDFLNKAREALTNQGKTGKLGVHLALGTP